MITVESVRAFRGFRSFRVEDLELMLGAAKERRFVPCEDLFLQGRPAVSCFMIVAGTAEAVREEAGSERVLTLIEPGTIVGQLGLINRAPRIATLRARTPVAALELSRDVFERLIRSASPLGNRFLMELAIATGRQLRDADQRLAALLARRGTSGHPVDPTAEIEAVDREIRRMIRGPADEPALPFDVVEVNPEDRARRR